MTTILVTFLELLSFDEENAGAFRPCSSAKDLEAFYYQFGVSSPTVNNFRLAIPGHVVNSFPVDIDTAKTREVKDLVNSTDDVSHQAGISWDWRHHKNGSKATGVAIRSVAFLFGSLSSVPECLAGSESIQAIVVVLLRIIALLYIDDVNILERENLPPNSSSLVDLFLEFTGWEQSYAKAERHSSAQETLAALGIAYILAKDTQTALISVASSSFIKALECGEDLLKKLNGLNLDLKTIEKLRGLARHVTQFHRVSNYCVKGKGLDSWRSEDFYTTKIQKPDYRRALRNCVKLLLSLVANLQPLRMSARSVSKKIQHVYSDASGNCDKIASRAGIARAEIYLGGFMNVEGGDPVAFALHVTQVPDWFPIKGLRVGVFELIAALLTFQLYSGKCAGYE